MIHHELARYSKSCKSKISRKCEFQPIKNLEITLTITLTINLRLTTFCEIDQNILPYILFRYSIEYSNVCLTL